MGAFQMWLPIEVQEAVVDHSLIFMSRVGLAFRLSGEGCLEGAIDIGGVSWEEGGGGWGI